jgi:hypothetical protein
MRILTPKQGGWMQVGRMLQHQNQMKQSRMNRELKQLDSLFNPSGMERQLIIENDEDGNGTDKEVPFLFLIG